MHERDQEATEARLGTIAGIAAYGLWGVFPLVFHRLDDVNPLEILFHRVIWSFVVVLVLVRVGRQGTALRAIAHDGRRFRMLTAAGVLVATNWLVYIWAVNRERVVEAALGYYINPLITVALGVVVLREHLRPAQKVAIGFGAAAVVVLTIAYGSVPWVALVLAVTFGAYGYAKKSVGVPATVSLAVETLVLLPVAVVGLSVMEATGDAAFGHGPAGRTVLLASLGVVTAVPLLLFGAAASRIPLSLLGLLQYLTPTLQLLCGVVVLHEGLPPERLAGFVLVWIALAVLAVDALRAPRPVLTPVENAG